MEVQELVVPAFGAKVCAAEFAVVDTRVDTLVAVGACQPAVGAGYNGG
jgi:hypothetical protein